jgi:hypothetical protein
MLKEDIHAYLQNAGINNARKIVDNVFRSRTDYFLHFTHEMVLDRQKVISGLSLDSHQEHLRGLLFEDAYNEPGLPWSLSCLTCNGSTLTMLFQ